jgi:hypothetical protein
VTEEPTTTVDEAGDGEGEGDGMEDGEDMEGEEKVMEEEVDTAAWLMKFSEGMAVMEIAGRDPMGGQLMFLAASGSAMMWYILDLFVWPDETTEITVNWDDNKMWYTIPHMISYFSLAVWGVAFIMQMLAIFGIAPATNGLVWAFGVFMALPLAEMVGTMMLWIGYDGAAAMAATKPTEVASGDAAKYALSLGAAPAYIFVIFKHMADHYLIELDLIGAWHDWELSQFLAVDRATQDEWLESMWESFQGIMMEFEDGEKSEKKMEKEMKGEDAEGEDEGEDEGEEGAEEGEDAEAN